MTWHRGAKLEAAVEVEDIGLRQGREVHDNVRLLATNAQLDQQVRAAAQDASVPGVVVQARGNVLR